LTQKIEKQSNRNHSVGHRRMKDRVIETVVFDTLIETIVFDTEE
jgi:hypothetical protein